MDQRSLVFLFATHLIPVANPVKVAELVNVFISLLSDILFGNQKKINPSTLLSQEFDFVCFAMFYFAVLEPLAVVH